MDIFRANHSYFLFPEIDVVDNLWCDLSAVSRLLAGSRCSDCFSQVGHTREATGSIHRFPVDVATNLRASLCGSYSISALTDGRTLISVESSEAKGSAFDMYEKCLHFLGIN